MKPFMSEVQDLQEMLFLRRGLIGQIINFTAGVPPSNRLTIKSIARKIF